MLLQDMIDDVLPRVYRARKDGHRLRFDMDAAKRLIAIDDALSEAIQYLYKHY